MVSLTAWDEISQDCMVKKTCRVSHKLVDTGWDKLLCKSPWQLKNVVSLALTVYYMKRHSKTA